MQITIDGKEQVAAAYIGAMGTDIDKSFMISGQFSPVRICKDGVIKINLQKYDVFRSSKKDATYPQIDANCLKDCCEIVVAGDLL